MKSKIALLITGGVLAAVSVHAQVILSPTAVIANTMGSYAPGFYTAQETINQNGLLSNFVSGVTNFNTYMATNPLHSLNAPTEFFAPAGVFSGTIDYDLGALYKVDRMAFWDEESWGAKTVSIFGSTVSNFSSSVGFGTFSLLDTAPNPGDSSVVDYAAQILTFSQASDVRYIRINILDSFPLAQSASIGEIALSASAPGGGGLQGVPEPSTYGAIGAAVLLGVVLRRRKAA